MMKGLGKAGAVSLTPRSKRILCTTALQVYLGNNGFEN